LGQIGQVGVQARGDGPGEMGAALPPIDFGPGAVPVSLSAGLQHTCVSFADKTVRCFGRNTRAPVRASTRVSNMKSRRAGWASKVPRASQRSA